MATKYALVTGCSAGGIGGALCAELARRGHHVFATARDPAKLDPALAALSAVTPLQLDVSSQSSLEAAAAAVRARTGGRLDVLVNNAGAVQVAPLLDADLAAARRLYDANVWGLLAATQVFAPLLIEACGVVVNVGSIAALACKPWMGIYSSSKAAAHAISETLRAELAPFGVRVITCLAGGVQTKIWDNLAEGSGDDAAELPPGSRYAPAAAEIRRQVLGADNKPSEESLDVFAANLVNDILAGTSGKVYRGSEAGLTKWLLPMIPAWAWVCHHISRGLPCKWRSKRMARS